MDQKKLKYIPIGDMLCAETAMIQAAQALDIAAYMAVELRNPETLLRVGVAWAEVAANLTSGGESDDDEEEEGEISESKGKADKLVGFVGTTEESINGRIEGYTRSPKGNR